MTTYLTWNDPEIKEILSVEKQFATEGLVKKLKSENIKIVEIEAESILEANKAYLDFYEQIHPAAAAPSTARLN